MWFKKSNFDADPLALLNCYKFNYDSLENNVDVILNIGLQNTTILVYGENQEILQEK